MRSNLHHITSKVARLAKWGRITCARKLFDEMPRKDVIAWNAMLSSYSQLGIYRETLSLFRCMRNSSAKPDHFTLTATLNACAGLIDIQSGVKIHALVVGLGFRYSLPVANSLIDMYGKCFEPWGASKVFQEMDVKNEVTWCSLLFAYTNTGMFDVANGVFCAMPEKVTIAWNIMMVGHASYGEIDQCLGLFREMTESSYAPDQWTLSALINACGESSEEVFGYMLHAFVIKTGWSAAVEVKNSIISFYAKIGCGSDAINEFESGGTLSQVSWNAVIDAYMKLGDTREAFNVFQHAQEKNVVSWTSMIAGYARNGDGERALMFFIDMMRICLCPDDFTFGAVLYACSSLEMLGHGTMVHSCVIRHGFCDYVYVGNGLVNMYAKCGDIRGSVLAFNEIRHKDLVSYNAMLFGFGMHGLASQALKLYDDLISSGTKPDKATFIALLITCSHSGLTAKGHEIFESMRTIHNIPYEMEHISCMVDMLGRSGHLTKAKELADKYAVTSRAKSSSDEALLGACAVHGAMELGANLIQHSKILDAPKEMSFVLLSNLYCASGKWKEAEMVRKDMADQGMKKMPGCSWIEVGNEMIPFVAGTCNNFFQPYMENTLKMLLYLQCEMKNPTTSFVVM